MNATTTRTERAQAEIATLKRREWKILLTQPDKRRRLGKRDAALLAVLLAGGLRVGEAVRLKIDEVEVEGPYTRIRTRTSKQKVRPGSPPPSRVVTLFPLAAKLLRDYIASAEPRFYLFEGRHHEHLSTSAARRAVKGYLKAIGRGDLRTHDLRHSFATEVIRTSRSVFIAAKLCGHSDCRTTQRYYGAWDSSDADAASLALTGAFASRPYRKTAAR